MNQVFHHEGFGLVAAFDVQNAVSKAALSPAPDLILIKDNADALKEMKENKTVSHIPAIIMLPAKSSAAYAQKMLDRGAAATIDMGQTSILQVIDQIKETLGSS